MTCPACRGHISSQIDPDCRPSASIEGSLNICNRCGALLVMEGGALRAASEGEVSRAMADPATRQILGRITVLLRKARHMRS